MEGTACRGIRGATTVDAPKQETVAEATVELLAGLIEANGCRQQDMAAVVFTLTEDLAGTNPAAAARREGWDDVPLLVVREHAGAGPARCIRVLALWNTSRTQQEIHHVYLRDAAGLRPDLSGEEG